MVTRNARTGRGLLAALLSLATAALSHSIAGAVVPSRLTLVLAFIIAAAVSIALAGKRLSRLSLASAVGFSQFGFHLLFSFFGPAAAASLPEGVGHHHHHAFIPILPESASAAELAQAEAAAGAALLMWLAHLIAAAVSYLLLRGGERALEALLGMLRNRLRAWWARISPPTPHAPLIRFTMLSRTVRLSGAPRSARLGSRGPPLRLIHP